MRRAGVAWALCALTLAGCLQASTPATASKSASAQPPTASTAQSSTTQANASLPQPPHIVRQTLRHFEGTYALQQTQVANRGSGTNCAMLVGFFQIREGTATVQWTPQPGYSPAMELVFETNGHVVAVGDGPTSAAIAFKDVSVTNGPRGADAPLAWQVSSHEAVGLALQMKGSLALKFDYWSDQNATVDPNWGCAIGH